MTQDVLEMTYSLDGVHQKGQFVRGGVGGLLIEGLAGEVDSLVLLHVTGGTLGTKSIQVLGRIKRMGGAAAEGVFPVKLLRMTSREGLPPLKEMLREYLGADFAAMDPEQVIRIGNFWAIICSPDDPDAALERIPRIELDALESFFKKEGEEKVVHLYLRRTVCYLINRVPYFGRAVRMNHQGMVVHTNMVLPTLGSPIQIQFNIDNHEGFADLAVVTGTVKRRSDQKDASSWKGRFEVGIRFVEEVEKPGIFFSFLDAVRQEQNEESEDED